MGLDALREQAARLATDWEVFLAGEVDSEQPLPPDEGTHPIPAGVVIAVILYHGNEHRGQICTILSTRGHESPDLTPWAYAFARGGYSNMKCSESIRRRKRKVHHAIYVT